MVPMIWKELFKGGRDDTLSAVEANAVTGICFHARTEMQLVCGHNSIVGSSMTFLKCSVIERLRQDPFIR